MAPPVAPQLEAVKRGQQLQLSIEASIRRLKVARLAMRSEQQGLNFDLQAELKEVRRLKGGAQLQFRLVIETMPTTQRAELEGDAFLGCDGAEVLSLEELGEEELGKIALEIYRSIYPLLYLLLDTMGLSAPSAWLVKDVHLVR